MRFNSGFAAGARLEMILKLAMELYQDKGSLSKDNNNQLHFWFTDDEDERNEVYTDLDENNEHVMILGIGLVEDIYSYAFSALARKEVWRFVGDASKERDIAIKAKYRDGDIFLSDMPVDEMRRDVAEKVAWYMVLFVIAHEMTHLINGHNRYLMETYGIGQTKFMEERRAVHDTYGKTRRVLEYDADMISANRMYNYMIKEVIFFDPAKAKTEIGELIFEIGGFAIYGVFALLSRETSDDTDLYMTLEQRALMVIGSIEDLLYEWVAAYRLGNRTYKRTKGYKYFLLIRNMICGFNTAADFSKKTIDANLKTYDELYYSNDDMEANLYNVNIEWNKLIKDLDLREAAVGNLFDTEEEVKWRKEFGFPEDIYDLLKDRSEFGNEEYMKRYYPEYSKTDHILREYGVRFNTGFPEGSRYDSVRELALELYENRTEYRPAIKSGLHFLFSNKADEIDDITTDIAENGEHIMFMGVNLFNQICGYVDTAIPEEAAKEMGEETFKKMSDWLEHFIFKVILDHEITHLIYGHNAYIKSKYGKSKIKMLGDGVSASKSYAKDRLVLEFDADAAAYRYMYEYMLENSNILREETNEVYPHDLAFTFGGYAVFCMLAILRRQKVYAVTNYYSIEDRIINSMFFLKTRLSDSEGSVKKQVHNESDLLCLEVCIEKGFALAAKYFKENVDPDIKSLDELSCTATNVMRILTVQKDWEKLMENPIVMKAMGLDTICCT